MVSSHDLIVCLGQLMSKTEPFPVWFCLSCFQNKSCRNVEVTCPSGGAGDRTRLLFFQIMDVINENEDHFLKSLEQGSRLIHRTLSRKDYKHGVFPGQFPSATWTTRPEASLNVTSACVCQPVWPGLCTGTWVSPWTWWT